VEKKDGRAKVAKGNVRAGKGREKAGKSRGKVGRGKERAAEKEGRTNKTNRRNQYFKSDQDAQNAFRELRKPPEVQADA